MSKVTGERRRNVHVVCYASAELPRLRLAQYWEGHYQSWVSGIQELPARRLKKQRRYLAGYMAEKDKERGDEKFMKARFSYGWVFPGWLSYSVEYKRLSGEYPSPSHLVSLARMPVCERRLALEVDLAQLRFPKGARGDSDGALCISDMGPS